MATSRRVWRSVASKLISNDSVKETERESRKKREAKCSCQQLRCATHSCAERQCCVQAYTAARLNIQDAAGLTLTGVCMLGW